MFCTFDEGGVVNIKGEDCPDGKPEQIFNVHTTLTEEQINKFNKCAIESLPPLIANNYINTPFKFEGTNTEWWYKIGQRNGIIRKMAEFISKFDIDETICKNVPRQTAKECNECEIEYGSKECKDCTVFYEEDCPYEDCVDCIINYFEKLE